MLLVLLGALAVVGARVLAPSHSATPRHTLHLPTGSEARPELVDQVLRYAPSEPTSVIEQARWQPDGLFVAVDTGGPRLVLLLDADGAASVKRVDGTGSVLLPIPAEPAAPPYTLTVLSAVGSGMVVDAQPLQVAAAP
ncbi:MAG: hypothetical protein H6742_03075 [Alphaproteobacteria bacterium]|nr:hypothetical protein [Alphaproteobacteria bacterium]